eukprot:jgi/Chrzof1/12015/Cz06g18060.t1
MLALRGSAVSHPAAACELLTQLASSCKAAAVQDVMHWLDATGLSSEVQGMRLDLSEPWEVELLRQMAADVVAYRLVWKHSRRTVDQPETTPATQQQGELGSSCRDSLLSYQM